MDDSFRVRVEKVFGSLSSSSSAAAVAAAAAPPSSMWCLSDEEIEKRELNREDRRDSPSDDDDEPPQPNNSLSHLSPDVVKQPPLINNVVDTANPDRDDDHWEIRSSIGLDCTLDYEEEEDEFDKLAVGREEVGGSRFYERDIDDYGIDFHDPNQISSSFDTVVDRDPRANRMAAKLRLIEDSEAAGDLVSSTLPGASDPSSIKQHAEEKINNPKPILKKREKPVETRSQKRVRFSNISSPGDDSSPSQGCSKEGTSLSEEESPQEPTLSGETKAAETCSSSMDEPTSQLQTDFSNQVPDYIQNPSRYTRYTLDSSNEVDEASNKKAFMEFSKLLSKPKANDLQPDDFDPSFPLIFTPRKRMDDDTCPLKMDTMSDPAQGGGEGLKDTANPVVIAAAANTDDDGVCAMDEDLQEDDLNHNRGSNKASRQYRSRASVIDDDSV